MKDIKRLIMLLLGAILIGDNDILSTSAIIGGCIIMVTTFLTIVDPENKQSRNSNSHNCKKDEYQK